MSARRLTRRDAGLTTAGLPDTGHSGQKPGRDRPEAPPDRVGWPA